MATLYDGVPVFAPAAGATALASDQVTLQSKLILGLEGRKRVVPLMSGVAGTAGAWTLHWATGTTPDVYWEETTPAANSELFFPVWCRKGEYITDARINLKSAVGSPTGGSVVLYANEIRGTDASPQVISDFGCTGNFWDTDNVITEYSDSGINYSVESGHDLYIVVLGPSGAPQNAYIYGIEITTQFHEGV